MTGSRYLIEAGGERLLVDCGPFQGEKELRQRNWSPLPVAAASIHALVLTHAHLDHTGYIPRFLKEGFRVQFSRRRPPLTSAASAAGLRPPAGRGCQFANSNFSKHKPALPLYTYEEALASLDSFRAVDESKPFAISEHFSIRYFPDGHILGARSIGWRSARTARCAVSSFPATLDASGSF